MSQMYAVRYKAEFPDATEAGEVIVCAPSNEAAIDIALAFLGLPASRTAADAQRVKPGIYVVSKHCVDKRIAIEPPSARALGDLSPAIIAHRAAERERAIREAAPDRPSFFDLVAKATLRAYSEAQAWRRMAKAIDSRVSSNLVLKEAWLLDISLGVETSDDVPRLTPTEKQSIYSKPRFFRGGASRPR